MNKTDRADLSVLFIENSFGCAGANTITYYQGIGTVHAKGFIECKRVNR